MFRTELLWPSASVLAVGVTVHRLVGLVGVRVDSDEPPLVRCCPFEWEGGPECADAWVVGCAGRAAAGGPGCAAALMAGTPDWPPD